MKWQPMPAMAREPSGTRVLVLCGQPEQNQGWRSASGVSARSTCKARAWPCKRSRCDCTRAATSLPSGSRPWRASRCASACAISAGVRSALARSNWFALGFGMDHSPPLWSAPTSSNLPSTSGRTSARQL